MDQDEYLKGSSEIFQETLKQSKKSDLTVSVAQNDSNQPPIMKIEVSHSPLGTRKKEKLSKIATFAQPQLELSSRRASRPTIQQDSVDDSEELVVPDSKKENICKDDEDHKPETADPDKFQSASSFQSFDQLEDDKEDEKRSEDLSALSKSDTSNE